MSRKVTVATASKVALIALLGLAANQISGHVAPLAWARPASPPASSPPSPPADDPLQETITAGQAVPGSENRIHSGVPSPMTLASFGVSSAQIERDGDLVAAQVSANVYMRDLPVTGYWVARLYDADGDVVHEVPVASDPVIADAGVRRFIELNTVVNIPEIPGTTAHFSLVDSQSGRDIVSTFVLLPQR